MVTDKCTGAMLLHVTILLQQLRNDSEVLNRLETTASELKTWILIVQNESRVRERSSPMEATGGASNIVVSVGDPRSCHLSVPRLEFPPGDMRHTRAAD
jgi:hypothetical protein